MTLRSHIHQLNDCIPNKFVIITTATGVIVKATYQWVWNVSRNTQYYYTVYMFTMHTSNYYGQFPDTGADLLPHVPKCAWMFLFVFFILRTRNLVVLLQSLSLSVRLWFQAGRGDYRMLSLDRSKSLGSERWPKSISLISLQFQFGTDALSQDWIKSSVVHKEKPKILSNDVTLFFWCHISDCKEMPRLVLIFHGRRLNNRNNNITYCKVRKCIVKDSSNEEPRERVIHPCLKTKIISENSQLLEAQNRGTKTWAALKRFSDKACVISQ